MKVRSSQQACKNLHANEDFESIILVQVGGQIPSVDQKKTRECICSLCSRLQQRNSHEHIDDLARECIACNIFTNAEQQEPGVWTGDVDLSRIENHDEMLQFINFGVDGRAHSLVYAHS